MRTEDLRRVHKAEPFHPFTIRVADGREYFVPHPEFLSYADNSRTEAVVTPDGFHDIIDTLMIASVHLGNGRPRRPRRRKGRA